jgi:uncharacterized protein YbaR (Trm112 family)
MIKRLNFQVLIKAIENCQLSTTVLSDKRELIEKLTEFSGNSTTTIEEQLLGSPDVDQLLAVLHSILFEYHIINGQLVCPTTGRTFAIKDGIPNMLLHEDEV